MKLLNSKTLQDETEMRQGFFFFQFHNLIQNHPLVAEFGNFVKLVLSLQLLLYKPLTIPSWAIGNRYSYLIIIRSVVSTMLNES